MKLYFISKLCLLVLYVFHLFTVKNPIAYFVAHETYFSSSSAYLDWSNVNFNPSMFNFDSPMEVQVFLWVFYIILLIVTHFMHGNVENR